MEIEVNRRDAVLFIKPLTDYLDTTVVREFKIKVLDLINQENELLVLNLSQVDFIDSNGLGCLISLLKSLVKKKGNMAICGARDAVIQLFNLTRLNQVFLMYPTENVAFDSLNKVD